MDEKAKYEIWEAVSYAWTEIGIDGDEYLYHARKIFEYTNDWDEVSEIAYFDVCAFFSVQTVLIFLFFPIMPDWGYSEEYLKKSIKRWYSKPKLVHWLNPLRVIGCLLSYIMCRSHINKIKKQFKLLQSDLIRK